MQVQISHWSAMLSGFHKDLGSKTASRSLARTGYLGRIWVRRESTGLEGWRAVVASGVVGPWLIELLEAASEDESITSSPSSESE